MSDNKVPLENKLCFSLYAASIAINRLYKPMLDDMGITYPQYLILTAVGEGEEMTVGAIASRLSLDSSTITPPVKRLEQGGFVERRRSQVDERLVHVWLTTKGRALLIRADCLGEALIEHSGMGAKALDSFNEQVKTLLSALQSQDGQMAA